MTVLRRPSKGELVHIEHADEDGSGLLQQSDSGGISLGGRVFPCDFGTGECRESRDVVEILDGEGDAYSATIWMRTARQSG
jgi:hypothetical protein